MVIITTQLQVLYCTIRRVICEAQGARAQDAQKRMAALEHTVNKITTHLMLFLKRVYCSILVYEYANTCQLWSGVSVFSSVRVCVINVCHVNTASQSLDRPPHTQTHTCTVIITYAIHLR